MQFEALPRGPKLIAGDLNGVPETFNTIIALTTEDGWTDVWMVGKLCNGEPGQYTCHSSEKAKESRIGFFSANVWLYPAIAACKVDRCGDYPTHRTLIIEVNVETIEKVTRELQKTTNCAKLLEEKIQG